MDDMRVHVRVRIDCDMNLPQKNGSTRAFIQPENEIRIFLFLLHLPSISYLNRCVLKALVPKSVRTTEIKHAIVI